MTFSFLNLFVLGQEKTADRRVGSYQPFIVFALAFGPGQPPANQL